jgi:ABC-2 type transport system ATP-binding protein
MQAATTTPDEALRRQEGAATSPREPAAEAAVVLDGLVKHYRGTRAVDGVDLVVRRDEIFGVLGPNGAGKTTTLEMIAGLRHPTRGSIRVLGADPLTDGERLRTWLSIQPQQAELFPNLTAAETLELWASFYPRPVDPGALLGRVGLAESASTRVHALSGGQERRLLVATALIGGPRIVVLDEPSTGLDPGSRAELWEVLIEFRAQGGTVLLSTHSMEEAESLCDRVAIIDRGRIVAEGTPAELIRRHAPEQVVTFVRDHAHDPGELRELAGVSSVDVQGNRVHVRTTDPRRAVDHLLDGPSPAQQVSVRNASLDNVFRQLTGRSLTAGGEQGS